MKINFRKVLTQFSGEPITGENNSPFTLGQCTVNALLQPTQTQVSPQDKVRRARIAERAYEAEHEQDGECDMSPEDVVLIRDCIGQIYPPLIVMKAFGLLEGDDKVIQLKGA